MNLPSKIALLVGGISLIVMSCATSTPNTTSNASPAPSATPKASAKPVEQSITKVTREEIRYADGVLASSTQYQYDAKGNLLSETQYDGKGGIILKKVSVYSANNKVVTITSSNASGLVQGTSIRELDDNGLVLKESIVNTKKEVESISEYSYDSKGIMLSWITKGPNQSVIASIKYSVKNGLTTQIDISDAGNQIIKRFEQAFNQDGKITSKIEKDSSGKILSQINYFYSNNLLTKEEYLNKDGVLQRSIAYVYNDKGQAIKTNYMDRKGQLMETKNQEFQVFSRSTTISE